MVFTAFIASEAVGVFMRIFLARSLTVAEYGLFYAVFAFISLFSLFRDPGLSSALAKYIPEFTVRKRFSEIKSSIASVLLIQASLGIAFSAALFILSDKIALSVFGTLDAALPIRILSVWFFVEIFRSLVVTLTQGFQHMAAYSSINFFHVLLIFVFTTFFIGALRLDINGVALSYLLAAALISILGAIFFVKKYPQIFLKKISINKPLLKKLLMFGLPIFIGGFGSLILTYTDTLTITVFRSLDEVGLYQAAQPSARILWYLTTTLTVVLYPMISELWAKNEKTLLRQALHFLTKFSFILIIPLALVFIAFPDIVINVLFGSRYLGGAAVLQIFGLASIVYALYDILITVITGIGRPFVVTKTIAIMALFNLVGDLALVPRYGIEGAAMITFTSFVIGLVLAVCYARKFIKFTVPTISLSKALVGGMLTLLLIFGLKSILVLSLWPKTFAVIIPSLLFYGVWILATKAVTKDELKLIAKIVPMPKWFVRAARKIVGE
jgi:O-antigen/teichoic acid export membrane protein